jgi:HSP20 family protein
MKLMKWQPTELERSVGAEPFFDKFFDLLGNGQWAAQGSTPFPAIDVTEQDDQLVVRFDLPGIDPQTIDLQVAGEQLKLRGERVASKESARYLMREQVYGTFSRAVHLSCPIDPENVRARYENGVLSVELPKAAEFMGRQIPVTVKS